MPITINLGNLRNLGTSITNQVTTFVNATISEALDQIPSTITIPPITIPPFPFPIPTPDPAPAPVTPTTIRGLLLDLLNERVQITTPFTTLTGTVISVQADYVAMVDAGGELYFVRLDKINTVTRVTGGV
ncbi:DUF2642 domain-containing protein [Mesobacillus foraminis]|uniref:DUF2642 domain-containing protein n=1 Tax=Mesobacillus foraminis TaxID=279826 RepID=UPI0013CEB0BB|nr:DUF2642 domain-containing protein [Mesobacillus foraminis]